MRDAIDEALAARQPLELGRGVAVQDRVELGVVMELPPVEQPAIELDPREPLGEPRRAAEHAGVRAGVRRPRVLERDRAELRGVPPELPDHPREAAERELGEHAIAAQGRPRELAAHDRRVAPLAQRNRRALHEQALELDAQRDRVAQGRRVRREVRDDVERGLARLLGEPEPEAVVAGELEGALLERDQLGEREAPEEVVEPADLEPRGGQQRLARHPGPLDDLDERAHDERGHARAGGARALGIAAAHGPRLPGLAGAVMRWPPRGGRAPLGSWRSRCPSSSRS